MIITVSQVKMSLGKLRYKAESLGSSPFEMWESEKHRLYLQTLMRIVIVENGT